MINTYGVGVYPGGSIASQIMNPLIKLAIKSLVNTAKNIKTPSNVCSEMYRIAGNFRGRKLSRTSRFFSHPRKFSP